MGGIKIFLSPQVITTGEFLITSKGEKNREKNTLSIYQTGAASSKLTRASIFFY